MTSDYEVATYELSNWRRDWQDRFLAVGIYPWLGPAGDRVAAPVRDVKGWTVAVNGEPWEGHWLKVSEPVFSRNGRKVAAVVSDGLGDTVAIDGQPWPSRFASALLPVLSFDGAHAAARVPSKGGYTVCVDGACWPEYYQEIDVLRFGPTGSRVAATVALEEMVKTLFGEGKMTIVVDGVAWPLVFRKCGIPNFSADGGKVAATVGDDRGETVAVDGVSWDAHFEGAFHCAISADGTHVVAGVREEGRWTAAVDGQPWPVWFDEPLEEPRFSSDGQHVLATVGESPLDAQLRDLFRTSSEAAPRPSPPPPFRVVVDGEIWRPDFVEATRPCFSPTTSELAAAVRDERGWTVAAGDNVWPSRFAEIKALRYSPDGRHVAATVKDTEGWTVAIDGETLAVRYQLAEFVSAGHTGTRLEDWDWEPEGRLLWLVGRDRERNWVRTEVTV